nr:hypothetical protein [uncultured bacterium]
MPRIRLGFPLSPKVTKNPKVQPGASEILKRFYFFFKSAREDALYPAGQRKLETPRILRLLQKKSDRFDRIKKPLGFRTMGKEKNSKDRCLGILKSSDGPEALKPQIPPIVRARIRDPVAHHEGMDGSHC